MGAPGRFKKRIEQKNWHTLPKEAFFLLKKPEHGVDKTVQALGRKANINSMSAHHREEVKREPHIPLIQQCPCSPALHTKNSMRQKESRSTPSPQHRGRIWVTLSSNITPWPSLLFLFLYYTQTP